MLNPGEMYGEVVGDVSMPERVVYHHSESFQRIKASHHDASSSAANVVPVFVPAKESPLSPSAVLPPAIPAAAPGVQFVNPTVQMPHLQQNALPPQPPFPPPPHMAQMHEHMEHVTEFVTRYESELPMARIDAQKAFPGYVDSVFEINDCVAVYVPERQIFKITGPSLESVTHVYEYMSHKAGYEVVDEDICEIERGGDRLNTPSVVSSIPDELYSTLPTDGRQQEAAAAAAAVANAEAALKKAGGGGGGGGGGGRWGGGGMDGVEVQHGKAEMLGGAMDEGNGPEAGIGMDEDVEERNVMSQARVIVRLEGRIEAQNKKIADLTNRERARCEVERQHLARIQQLEAALQGLHHAHGALQHHHASLNQAHQATSHNLHVVASERDRVIKDMQAALADLTCTKAMVHDSGRFIQHQTHQIQTMHEEIMALRAGNMHQHDIIMKKMNEEKEKESSSFSLASIKEAIESAVNETLDLPEEERKSRVRSLRVRWHPDKNPILREFATEVTKIINESLKNVEERIAGKAEGGEGGGGGAEEGSAAGQKAGEAEGWGGGGEREKQGERSRSEIGKENDSVAGNGGGAAGGPVKTGTAARPPVTEVSDVDIEGDSSSSWFTGFRSGFF